MIKKNERSLSIKAGGVDSRLVYVECRGDEVVPDGAHSHDSCEIYINLSGDLAFEVEGLVYPIFPGCAIVTAPGEKHHCIYRSNAIHKHYCLWFRSDGLEELFPEIFKRARGTRNLYSFTPDSFASLIRSVDKLMSAEGARSQIHAFYSLVEKLFAGGMSDSAESAALPEDVALAVTFINENISSKITISDVAERARVNITTLERHFSAVFRITPIEYIKKRRLGEAERLISEGESVTNACYMSGFSDLSKFISVFKQRFGKTPKQYQLSLRD